MIFLGWGGGGGGGGGKEGERLLINLFKLIFYFYRYITKLLLKIIVIIEN